MIIWIRCDPGRKIMFGDDRRRRLDGPSGVIKTFTNKDEPRAKRM